ncbi:MAG TPA: ACT domain-containing protein [Candidatus Nanoarchaeia archaeon]|nr:ACT domain-containing protein [Candidatus Nanoarchaeia archaeon]
MEDKKIKQISVFAENKSGRLEKITRILKSANINIRAFNIAEAGDFGVLRMVVDQTDKAHEVLHEAGFTVAENDVLGVAMQDTLGGLYEIAKVLGDDNVNVDYAYAFGSATKNALLILRVDNIDNAINVLRSAGVNLFGMDDAKLV